MARDVKWADAAWSDLQNIADYIARDSRYYAASFVREVRNAARSLERFAKKGRVVPEFGDSTVRELFVKKYRLLYKIRGGTVYIIGLIHGARDLSSLWKKEGRRTRDDDE